MDHAANEKEWVKIEEKCSPGDRQKGYRKECESRGTG